MLCAYKCRLYPNETQAHAIDEMLNWAEHNRKGILHHRCQLSPPRRNSIKPPHNLIHIVDTCNRLSRLHHKESCLWPFAEYQFLD